jgi:beta-lactamase superfamily II metal-dependent hydrolase
LKAYHGDCILIKTYDSNENEFIILIDGGTAMTFDYHLSKELKHLKKIDLLVLTHIDSDHISGLIKFIKNSLFEKIEIKKYWINALNLLRIATGDKISYNQGKTFEELLLDKNELSEKWDEEIYFDSKLTLPSFMTAEIFSPTKEILDTLYEKWPILSKEITNKLTKVLTSGGAKSQIDRGSLTDLSKESFKPNKSLTADIVNSSSIAFVLKLLDCSILLLGDSRAEVIVESLIKIGITNDNPLEVDYVKISHHGSINNTSCELLDLIKCDNFIISTNGGNSSHKHPDREVIARIIHHPKRNYSKKRTIYFNYSLTVIQKKCGKLFNKIDFLEGNWEVMDNINILSKLK